MSFLHRWLSRTPTPQEGGPPGARKLPEPGAGAAGPKAPEGAPQALLRTSEGVLAGYRGGAEELWSYWLHLRSEYEHTGMWPLLLELRSAHEENGLLSLETLGELDEERAGGAERVVEASELELREHWPEWLDQIVAPGQSAPPIPALARTLAAAGTSPAVPSSDPSALELGEFEALVLIPTPPWAAPAWLNWYGPANYDISGVEVSAVLRQLQARYGAVLVELDYDTLWLWVEHPPKGAEARELGVLLDSFCPDAIAQDLGSMEELVAMLEGTVWRLWWD